MDSGLVKYIVKSLKKLELYEDALNYVSSMLSNNLNYNLLNIEVDLLIILKKIDDACEIAKFVTSMHPDKPEVWISLSEVYLKRKNYENCLKALNNIYYLRDGLIMKQNKNTSEILFKE